MGQQNGTRTPRTEEWREALGMCAFLRAQLLAVRRGALRCGAPSAVGLTSTLHGTLPLPTRQTGRYTRWQGQVHWGVCILHSTACRSWHLHHDTCFGFCFVIGYVVTNPGNQPVPAPVPGPVPGPHNDRGINTRGTDRHRASKERLAKPEARQKFE